jgi:tRNA A37 threonylcarbamoyladenosine dehydratase
LHALLGGDFDYLIDAIDQVRTKAAMIAWAKRCGVPLITAGGAGGQIDPTRIRIADLAFTIQDPLLAKVRSLLRKDYGFPREAGKKFGVPAVFSSEPLRYPGRSNSCEQPRMLSWPELCRLRFVGLRDRRLSGLLAAGEVLKHLAGTPSPEADRAELKSFFRALPRCRYLQLSRS